MKINDVLKYQQMALEVFDKLGVVLTPEERNKIEIADFGLNEFEKTGLALLTYVNTKRCCAKELIMLPHQICPNHLHPTIDGVPGKEETFRCRVGRVHLHIYNKETDLTEEIILNPGDQYIIYPDTFHWFQAGPEGAMISEFSTMSTDDQDVFTDPRIIREPRVDE